MTVLTLTFLAPIPVGHRVTVRAVEAAVVDDGKIAFYARTTRALVRDDETGIVYCSPDDVPSVDPVGLTLRGLGGGYRVASEMLEARVVSCVVGSRGSDNSDAMVTLLVLEERAPGGPYRTG